MKNQTSTTTTTARKATPSADNAMNTKRTGRADKTHTEKAVITLTAKQQAWKAELFEAVAAYEQAGVKLYKVVLRARTLKVPVEAVKALMVEAYIAAGNTRKSAVKRGSDAAVIINAPKLPAGLPGNLQRAAGEVRKAAREKKGQQRAPQQPGQRAPAKATAKTESAKSPASMASLVADIESLRGSIDDADALSILAEMADLASDLADRLAVDSEAA